MTTPPAPRRGRGRPPTGRLIRGSHQDSAAGWALLRALAAGRGISPSALIRALVYEEALRLALLPPGSPPER